MGCGWNYKHVSEVFDEMRHTMPSIGGITWDRLERESSVTYPCEQEGDPGTKVVFTQNFPTANGRAKFVPASLIPAAEQPDKEYPFVLITGRQLEHWHTGSMTRRATMLDALEPDPVALAGPGQATVTTATRNSAPAAPAAPIERPRRRARCDRRGTGGTVTAHSGGHVVVLRDPSGFPVRVVKLRKLRLVPYAEFLAWLTENLVSTRPAAGTALAAVDEGLLELLPNNSWQLLDAMMARRGEEVETATAQMQVIGKVWVVTGGGNGMGRQLVLQLLRRGARVAAVDVRPGNGPGEPLGLHLFLDAGGGHVGDHSEGVADMGTQPGQVALQGRAGDDEKIGGFR